MNSITPIENQQKTKIRQHNTFSIELRTHPGKLVNISSDFDSGNLASAVEEYGDTFRLKPCSDIEGVTGSKTWFYFKAQGFPANYKARFIIEQMNCLYSFGRSANSKKQFSYKPCRKVSSGNWEKFEEGVSVEKGDGDDTRLRFEHTFSSEDEEVFFAFTYPYEYGRYIKYIKELQEQYQNQDQICFRKQLVSYSVQQRPVYIITITSSEEKKIQSHKSKKPIVLISSRVHPGEVPSSYTVEGIIKFLLSKKDLRAYILRRLFSFKIIPMLNPDGVYRGHYRMDSLGQNLNRYYNKDCNKQNQPAIFQVKNLIQKYSKQQRLLFYFDLHAHAGRKGSFIYGNSLSNFIHQVEANVFCKLMALNTSFFEYSCCNFSQKHMSHKDKYQELTKDNCGRVFAYKASGIIHSFTLELAYHFTNLNTVTSPTNINFQVGKYKYVPGIKNQSKIFGPDAFMQIGEAMLISILDCLGLNPYTKVPNGQYQNLALLRRATAFAIFQSDDKFKTFDLKIYPKVKNVNSILNQSYYDRLEKMFKFSQTYNRLFQNSEWTHCVQAAAKKIEMDVIQPKKQLIQQEKQLVQPPIIIKQKQVLSEESENSSQSSDRAFEPTLIQSNLVNKKFQTIKNYQSKNFLQLSHMKYGSATIVKHQLPSLQSRGNTPTVRNATAQKQKKPKPILEIQTLKLKIKQEFVKQLKNELSKQQLVQNNLNNKIQKREHRSLKRVTRDNINLQTGVINSNIKVMGTNNTKDVSPLNMKTLEAPRLSQIYLPFLSK